ncbi:hypothetical protein D9M70_593110 [compost metagenome]
MSDVQRAPPNPRKKTPPKSSIQLDASTRSRLIATSARTSRIAIAERSMTMVVPNWLTPSSDVVSKVLS